MLAACTGRGIPPRASDGFVEGTFDSFAASFESKLAKLSYRAPALVAAMLEDAGIDPSKSLEALDAGCGTGLCGPLIAPYVRRLTGIDLSAGMLAQAKEKNVYDELFKIELTEYMRDNTETFDLIVSADTLVYFGGAGRGHRCGREGAATRRAADFHGRARGRRRGRRLSPRAARPLRSLPGVRRAAARGAGSRVGDCGGSLENGIGYAGGGPGRASDEAFG